MTLTCRLSLVPHLIPQTPDCSFRVSLTLTPLPSAHTSNSSCCFLDKDPSPGRSPQALHTWPLPACHATPSSVPDFLYRRPLVWTSVEMGSLQHCVLPSAGPLSTPPPTQASLIPPLAPLQGNSCRACGPGQDPVTLSLRTLCFPSYKLTALEITRSTHLCSSPGWSSVKAGCVWLVLHRA